MLLRHLSRSQFSISVVAIPQFYELSTPTVGEEVKEELSERKNGVDGGSSINIPKHHNHLVKREPSRDHDLGIFIFCKFICCKLR